jgi:hypothetical protein
VVVGDRRPDLRGRRGIDPQRVEAVRQFLIENCAVGGHVLEVLVQVVGDADGVEPHAKHLDVLGFLERELGQVHLVAQPAFGPHRVHERLNVLGHGFLAGDELGAESGGVVAFVVRKPLPVGAVAGEVDVGRVPELRIAAGK